MLKKLCRIYHNTDKWRSPTDKSEENKKSFGFEHKYVMEDWLNRSDWELIDQNTKDKLVRYSHLTALKTKKGCYTNKKLQVFLFVPSGNRKGMIVGILEKCSVIDEDEARKVAQEFENNGWLTLMINEIEDIGGKTLSISSIIERPLNFFNIKFDRDNLVFFDNPIPIDPPGLRYAIAYNWKNEFLKNIGLYDGISVPNTTDPRILARFSEQLRFTRAIGGKSYYPRQAPIQNTLAPVLRMILPEYNVTCEDKNVDIKLVDKFDNDNTIFIEIKCLYDARKSIRNSIGQLLEYSLYGSNSKVDNFVIVSDNKAGKEDVNYLIKLKKNYNLNFSYLYWPKNFINCDKISEKQIKRLKKFFIDGLYVYLDLENKICHSKD
jgi:hypothetical protein